MGDLILASEVLRRTHGPPEERPGLAAGGGVSGHVFERWTPWGPAGLESQRRSLWGPEQAPTRPSPESRRDPCGPEPGQH